MLHASVRGLHPLRRAVPDASVGLPRYPPDDPITPAHASRHRRFGLFPVRSPLLGESFLLSFPAGTKMFQFPAFASRNPRDVGIAPDGLPHSDIRGSRGICPSPRLFAACHVLLRLREPRHPPCALDRSVMSSYCPFPRNTTSPSCVFALLAPPPPNPGKGRPFALLFRFFVSFPHPRQIPFYRARLRASIMSSCSSW